MTVVVETFRPVASSNIAQFTYDPQSEELTVEFQNGSTYVYSSVPVETYRAWCAAGGSGKWFYRNIRDVYSYEKQ